MKLYLVTETVSGEAHVFLSDHKHKEAVYEDYSLIVKEAALSDVTLSQLAQAVDDDLENANYHSMVGIGEWIAKHLLQSVDEKKAKEIFWNMVQDKGLLWEF